MTGRHHHYHYNHHHHNQQSQQHHHHHHHQHYYGYGSLGLALVACVVLSSAAAASATATGPGSGPGPGPGTGTSKRAAATGFSHTVRIPGSGVSFRREGSRPQPCTHLGDAVNAVSARAFSASTVFEGKARSRSPARRPPGLYAVTFVVQHVHKDGGASGGGALPLRPRSQVRLQFREKRPRSGGEATPGAAQTCRQSYGVAATPGELVRANIKRGGKYIVFVEGVGPHNFSVLGEPVFRTRKNLKAVREVLCPDCFRAASVSGLQNTTVKAQERLQLVCRCKGNPLPAISWYKNGQSINVSSSLRIVFKKKRSSLVIPRVGTEDGGRYECRATTVMGTFISSWATVTVLPHTSPPVTDNTTTLWPLYGVQCPIPEYCLNGGTCTYYETVGELVCQCADGFKGQRCESKDVYNRSSMYRPMSYFCKLGISSSYYC